MGLTSQAVVTRLRRALNIEKAGHTGTLDPAASGVLPVFVGDATKLTGRLLEGDKVYELAVLFGARSATDDAEGPITPGDGPPPRDAAAVAALCARFVGPQRQTPPALSAVKVGGTRAYALARRGETPVLAPRDIIVYAATVTSPGGVPDDAGVLRITVRASKGTYMRTLARDMGEAAGCGAYLAGLRRLACGPVTINDCLPLDRILADKPPPVPVGGALIGLPEAAIDAERWRDAAAGRAIALSAPDGETAVVAPDGMLCAIVAVSAGAARVVRVLRMPPEGPAARRS